MAEQESNRGGASQGVKERLIELLPARLRPGIAVVPVVRLSGVIGAVTPLRPGMSLAGVAKTLEHCHPTTLTAHEPVCARVERVARTGR